MTDILNNTIHLCIGCLIGLYLGWTFKTMQYTKQLRDVFHPHPRRDEKGWYTRSWALGLVLIFTAVAAFWTGAVNIKVHKSQDCTEKAVTAIVGALNDRTSLSTTLALADADQNKAFSKLISAILSQPQPDKQVLSGLFQDYATKLSRYLGLQDSLRTAQEQNPYPKNIDYHNCLEGN